MLVNGGNGADWIATTTVDLTGVSGSTIDGGAGHDTIKFNDAASAQVWGGAGTDSISAGNLTALDTSINGGAGADTITFMDATAAHSAITAVITINGGAGVDDINLGSYTAGGTTGSAISAAVIGTVVYGSGDVIQDASTFFWC